MRLYSIRSDGHNWHNSVSYCHTVLFHGEAVLPFPGAGYASHNLGEQDDEPIRLIVNAYQIPHVFMPERSSNLIVSQAVCDILRPLASNFTFRRACFDKVYSAIWSFDNDINYLSPDIANFLGRGNDLNLHSAFPHLPDVAESLSPYYEIVPYNHYEVFTKYPTTQRIFTKNYIGEQLDSDLIPVSAQLFSDYPITDAGFTLVRGDLFDSIEPYIRVPFFGIKEFDIS